MKIKFLLLVAPFISLMSGTTLASDFRIGLQDNVDSLDPARSSTYVSNLIYASMCERLVGLSADLKFVPQLATKWSWSDDNKQLKMELAGCRLS